MAGIAEFLGDLAAFWAYRNKFCTVALFEALISGFFKLKGHIQNKLPVLPRYFEKAGHRSRNFFYMENM